MLVNAKLLVALTAAVVVGTVAIQTNRTTSPSNPGTVLQPVANPATGAIAAQESVVFAGGCFWGVQGVFQHTKGVISATSGYSGGAANTAKYDLVSNGNTGHAEAVKVVYDPSKVSYETLLAIFFSVVHDPTELNKQGPDHGTQYRSAVFTVTDEQKRATTAYIDKLTKEKRFNSPIVTEVTPLKAFFDAEAYHQDYATLHPTQPYIAYNDLPKIANLKKEFPALWREEIHPKVP